MSKCEDDLVNRIEIMSKRLIKSNIENAALKARVERLRDALLRASQSGGPAGGKMTCPGCGWQVPDHAPKCWLAAALAEGGEDGK